MCLICLHLSLCCNDVQYTAFRESVSLISFTPLSENVCLSHRFFGGTAGNRHCVLTSFDYYLLECFKGYLTCPAQYQTPHATNWQVDRAASAVSIPVPNHHLLPYHHSRASRSIGGNSSGNLRCSWSCEAPKAEEINGFKGQSKLSMTVVRTEKHVARTRILEYHNDDS